MIITKTPLRMSFFGGGTDYPVWYREHGGAVLSTTIDKYCIITCRHLPPFFKHKIRLVWSQMEMVKHADEIVHPTAREIIKFLGAANDGLEIHHDADLPARSGLGSSSAFTVGLLHALYGLLEKEPTKMQLALEAIHIEQERVQECVGSQDQVAAAFGGLNFIEFSPSIETTDSSGRNHIKVTPIEVDQDIRRSFEERIMLFFTGLARNAPEVAAEQVQLTPKKKKELASMRRMVDIAVSLLKEGKPDDFGRLLHENWQIKRTLSSQISNSVIDNIYETGMRAGALGGKLLGAGNGGFIMFFVDPERQAHVRKSLERLLYVPVRFENEGSQIIFNGKQALFNAGTHTD